MQEVIRMVRLNITMPENLAAQLKSVRNKSSFIAEAVREKFQKERKKQLEIELIEGYQAIGKEEQDLVKDWDIVSGDGLE